MIYYRTFQMCSTMSSTSVAEKACSSTAPDFTPVLVGLVLLNLYSILFSIVCPFVLYNSFMLVIVVYVLPLYTAFDDPFGIFISPRN